MAVVFAAGFAVLFVVAVVAGSVWTLFLWGVTSIGIGCCLERRQGRQVG